MSYFKPVCTIYRAVGIELNISTRSKEISLSLFAFTKAQILLLFYNVCFQRLKMYYLVVIILIFSRNTVHQTKIKLIVRVVRTLWLTPGRIKHSRIMARFIAKKKRYFSKQWAKPKTLNRNPQLQKFYKIPAYSKIMEGDS